MPLTIWGSAENRCRGWRPVDIAGGTDQAGYCQGPGCSGKLPSAFLHGAGTLRLLGHVVRITLLVPLVALALALLVAGWILLTETGGRWALDQVRGFGLRALRVHWPVNGVPSPSYTVTAGARGWLWSSLTLSWRPSCLFSAALCVDNLSAGRVAIALPDTGDAESPDTDAAISLPEISTPLSVEVARLEVGTITLNESLILERIAFAGAFSGPRLTIDTLNVEREALSAGLDGTVRFEGDWPVDAGLELEYVLSGDDYPGTLVLTSGLTGTVAELAVNADLAAPWQAHLAGVVEPLKPGFPANASPDIGPFPGDAGPAAEPDPESG